MVDPHMFMFACAFAIAVGFSTFMFGSRCRAAEGGPDPLSPVPFITGILFVLAWGLPAPGFESDILFFDVFLFFNAFNEICKEIIGQMDFALLRDRLILGAGICAVLRFFVFLSFSFHNAFNEICKEIIGQMDSSLLRDRLILGPGIFLFSRFFVFLCFLFFNAFNEICKETIGQMDFSLLRDRPILGPRISVAGRSNVFSSCV